MTTPVTSTVDLPMGLTLEPDYLTIPSQNFALVSFVGPEFCRQKSGKFAMKVRGVFATEDEAKAYVRRLQRAGDNAVDIFLVAMYNWVPCPPDPMAVETQEYQETFLNDLMQGYAESQRNAKEMFADRKNKVMKDGLDAHLLPEERIPPPTKPLDPPELLPKFEKTIIEDIEEENVEAEKIDESTSQVVDAVFESDDVWAKRRTQ